MNKRYFLATVIFLCLVILLLLGVIFARDLTDSFQRKRLQNPVESEIYRNRTVKIPQKELDEAEVDKAPQVQATYGDHLVEAQELIEHSYFSKATMVLSDLIRKKPKKIEAYLMLGDIYLQERDLEKLQALIDSLENQFPNNPEVALLRTRKWIAEEKFGLVLGMLEGFESLTPHLRWYQTVLYSLQNNHKAARESLLVLQGSGFDDEVLEAKIDQWDQIYRDFDIVSEGKNAHLFALFAKALAESGEPLLARHFADLSIKDEIGYIDAWVLRGYSSFLMQEYARAVADLRHAYNLDPARPQTQDFLALALYEQEQYQEAGLYFEQVLEHDFEFSESVRWKLVDIFSRQKKYEKALGMYETLLQSESDPQRFVSAVDIAVNVLGKPEVALHFTEELIEKDPDSIFLNNLYGWALIANKQYYEAQQVLEAQLDIDPRYARTHLNLGLLYEEQERYSKAREYYKKAYLYGKTDAKLLSVVNLASERHNALLEKEDRPEEEEVLSDREENSP